MDFEFNAQHLKPKIYIGLGLIGITLVCLIMSANLFFFSPKIVKSAPTKNSVGFGLKDTLQIKFNRPIDRKKIKISFSPDVPGSLGFSNSIFNSHLYKQIDFKPDKYFQPNTDYTVKIEEIANISNTGKPKNYQFSFKTQSIPTVSDANISNGQTDVNAYANLELNLSEANNGLAEFNFLFEPSIDYDVQLSSDFKKYTIKPKNPLLQGTKYNFYAERKLIFSGDPYETNSEKIFELSFETKKAPFVKTYSPQGDGVLTTTPTLSIDFFEAMDKDDVLNKISISPAVSGEWKFENDNRIVFNTGERLNYATNYKITIPKDTKSLHGFFENDIVLSFTTIGEVRIISTYPMVKSTNVSTNTNISATFNQPVDHSSAENAFTISPATDGDFDWQGNKLVFNPRNNLANNTSYTFKFSPNIKSINGLNSTATYSYTFSTEESIVLLNVASDLQDKNLSCEAAALKMALAYKGVRVSENDIMNIIGFDPTIKNGNTWGDPDVAFVGDINGRQNTTGYGVHWNPIANAANHWRSARAFSGWSITDLTHELANGNPIVIWGIYGNGYSDPWYTPSGKKVNAWKGEHARTLIGFKGSPENPTAFIINCPYAGRITWTKEQLISNWSTFGNSGVVVY